MLYEKPEYAEKGRDQHRKCRIETAKLANGQYGVGVKHDTYMIFLTTEAAIKFAQRIADTITEAKELNATEA